MSFRRFVNLVGSDCDKNNYTLRRIGIPRTGVGGHYLVLGQDPPPVEEDCRLPDATMNFYPPQRVDDSHGNMDFMLLKNKVVATRREGPRPDVLFPFFGVAEYVPELHRLWFGISSRDHGSVLCASDLAAGSSDPRRRIAECRPPVLQLHQVFDDHVAGSYKEGWRLLTSPAVHLASGKFCIARFFDRT